MPPPIRSVRAFRLAMALALLHLLDTAFVHLEPGVARSEHLPATVVPVVLVLLAAWGIDRLRPLARAATLLTAGSLAATDGSLSLWHAWSSGLNGHDVTGIPLVVVGVTLLALGVADLWVSRRRDGRRRRVLARRTGWTVVAVVLITNVVVPVALAISVVGLPRRDVGPVDLGVSREQVTLHTDDGLVLPGLYVPSRNGAAIILTPGRGNTGHAELLIDAGYGVLMFDSRGEGEAEGEPSAVGWQAARDVAAAIDHLLARQDLRGARIGGLGISVGGESLLQAAAERPELLAVASDGAGTRSVAEILRTPGSERLLATPFNAVFTAAAAVLSGMAPPPSMQSVMPRVAPRPVLLIQAGRGQGGEHLSPQYQALGGDTVQRWLIPEARHTAGLQVRPDEYRRRVIEFFDTALDVRRPTGR